MRTHAAATVAVLATVGWLTSARWGRSHEVDPGGVHWASHGAGSDNATALLVVDTTGDRQLHAALRDFASRWNLLRQDPGLSVLPRVTVMAGDPTRGCHAPPTGASAYAGAGHVLVCRDDSLAHSGVGGPYWVDGAGHIRFGLVKFRRSTFRWSTCNLRTAVAHEMGHVMGLPHNETAAAGAPSVMMPGQAPYHRGCPTWFDEHDRQALRALYGPSTMAAR